MDRSTAIKKLTKMFGKSFGYRIDEKAPPPEERAATRTELPATTEKMNRLRDQRDARAAAILKADSEYQALNSAYKIARVEKEKLASKLYRHKITVGTSDGMFFMVEAEGDSWEEIFAKLDKEKATKKV